MGIKKCKVTVYAIEIHSMYELDMTQVAELLEIQLRNGNDFIAKFCYTCSFM